jgi:hypothetical protein
LTDATCVLGKPRYAPSELVDEIVEGSVKLSISKDEFERRGGHDDHSPPATTPPE